MEVWNGFWFSLFDGNRLFSRHFIHNRQQPLQGVETFIETALLTRRSTRGETSIKHDIINEISCFCRPRTSPLPCSPAAVYTSRVRLLIARQKQLRSNESIDVESSGDEDG